MMILVASSAVRFLNLTDEVLRNLAKLANKVLL